MPANQRNSKTTNNSVRVNLTGSIDAKYYVVSEEGLILLEEFSDSSSKLDFALFFLALASALLTTLLTTNIENRNIFAAIVATTSVSFIVGGFLYISHRNTKNRLNNVLRKIKKAKCSSA